MTYQEFQRRYQYHPVNDRVGKGGFGVVFKAYDTHLDRYVAIKMSEVDDYDSPLRLAREVELASKLPTHSNIAHYEDCYTFSTPIGTFDFGVLQFYNDGSLDDLIKSNSLTTADKISILKQILNGIGFLHKNRIVHRDLKPRNILIARRNDKYIPKITDFGISKEFDAENSAAFGNSMVGAGTLSYSSPEQLSERSIHRNTDLWSYGIIAYQLFTGKLPFTTGEYSPSSHEGRIELFRQVNSGILPDEIHTIPEPWQGAIRRLLIVDPLKRFRGCTAVKDFLVSGIEPKANTVSHAQPSSHAQPELSTPSYQYEEYDNKESYNDDATMIYSAEDNVKSISTPTNQSVVAKDDNDGFSLVEALKQCNNKDNSKAPDYKAQEIRSSDSSFNLAIAINKSSKQENAGPSFKKDKTVKYKVGDYYNSQNISGIVFETNIDGSHGKILSFEHIKAQWCNTFQFQKNIFLGATDNSDGKFNNDVLANNVNKSSYTAYIWCRNLSGNWYLPSKQDLITIQKNLNEINNTLIIQDEDIIQKNARFWSSTEVSDIFALAINMNDGYEIKCLKDSFYEVRAVSEF